jgi:pyrroline-5-carboxylate reductase
MKFFFLSLRKKNRMKIAILGCGNLGISILNGIYKNDTSSIFYLTKRRTELFSHLQKPNVLVSADNKMAVKNAEIILISVKPYDLKNVLEEINEVLDPKKHVIISVATGITIEEIKKTISPQNTVFRAMPNTAADVMQSMTCIATDNSNEENILKVKSFFDSIGNTLLIQEDLMESATVLASCGIAYVLRFMRSMVQGGIQIGFDSKTANEIVNHVVKGAAELLIQRGAHPEEEIDKVTTPKGCTIIGLNEMEHNGFSSSLIKGISASYKQIEK